MQKHQGSSDASVDLKRGAIKGMLIASFEASIPDFKFSSYKNGVYYFVRVRKFRSQDLFEALKVFASLRDGMLSCSVTSVVNNSYLYSSAYSNALLNGQIDVLTLKTGSGISSVEDAYYWHDGKVATVESVIDQITKDFKEFGVAYLDLRFNALQTSELVRFGLEFIEKLTINKDDLRREIDSELKKSELVVSRIKHPVFFQLRDGLQNIPNQSREDRQKISKLAFELIEYYYSCGS